LLPLQLDSSDPAALEAGLRVYNGKAAVNSVNGDPEVLERILPIVKKYGASVVGLTLDKKGIPQTAEERAAIARRILDAALEHGISRDDLWIDCLTLTVSAQQEQAAETLKAMSVVRREMGLQTVLGVSNISFGLPDRALVTQSFLTQALYAGLTLPIVNPNQKEMMDAVAAFRVLSGEDAGCRAYVERFAGSAQIKPAAAPSEYTLEDAVIRGLRAEAGKLAKAALETEDELSVVENRLIPALDAVGGAYERGEAFLPQLLSAAQAAQAVFEVIRTSIAGKGGAPVKKGRIAVATVQGDIHDIGKNIVKTVLENYGYELIDLGRDVPPESVLQAVKERDARLVGLSALMTTTLPAMEETVRQLRALPDPPAIMVGGAVVTPEYAEKIGADYYAKDARQAAEIARKVLGA
jgi:5-methyltetrahydrofolate--homocysteine methyltransferase